MARRNRWIPLAGIAAAAAMALGGLAGPPRAIAGDFKVGFVDLDKALNECAAGKKAVEGLKKKKDKYETEGKRMGDELVALKDQYEKQSLTMNDESRRQREREIRDRERDLQTFVRDKQEEIGDERNRKMQTILKDLKKVIHQIGEAGGYTLVLEKSQLDESVASLIPPVILYAQAGEDLTAEVIARYDKQAPAAKAEEGAAKDAGSTEGKGE